MTPEVALKLGMAIAVTFRERHRFRSKILIGKDTRLSCYMFEQAMAAGICSMGADALLVGPLPTPGIAFLAQDMRAEAGVVISASHNPYNDNGIKFFDSNGYKLPDAVEEQIEALVLGNGLEPHRAFDGDIGRTRRIDDALGRYIVYLKNTFPRELSLEGLSIVVDCANGAAYKVAPTVLYELGAEVHAIGISPNGLNINDNCGALHPETLAARVLELGADIGIALDGDADRCMLVDETGAVLDGDHMLAICGIDALERKQLPHNTLVATQMSNLGLDLAIKAHGGTVVKTNVGDRYVVEEMQRSGYSVGGEQSGHLIFADYSSTGDGILSALQLLAVMKRRGERLSTLRGMMQKLPQVLLNLRVIRKTPIEALPDVLAAISRAEAALGEKGRVFVRYSGTEPKVRVMIEGPDESIAAGLANAIVEAFRKSVC